MLAQLSRFAAAHSPPIQGGDTSGCETLPCRAVLVAPSGLFRDGFAHLIATCIAEIRLECHDRVDDIVPGVAGLGLLAIDLGACSREALSASIEALRTRCLGAPIGLLILDDRAPAAVGLGALGVAGVVSLSVGVEVAAAAVRLMLVGGYCLPPEVLSTVAHPIASDAGEDAETESQLKEEACAIDERAGLRHDLTARERDVLHSLRSGHQNKIIAYELGISESTVKVHLRNIMKKLNASNRTQVALGGPLLLDRSGARIYAAVAPQLEFHAALPEGAQGVPRVGPEVDLRRLA
jgi:DNA-binding NarL/FixJ family response regulator